MNYLQKSALFPPQISEAPAADLGLIVVIPAYREPALLKSLEALHRCALPTLASVEVIVVLNDREGDTAETLALHQQSYVDIQAWAKIHNCSRRRFFVLYQSGLAAKRAGVGLARKIGMDEAVYRLLQVEQPQGIIACFDADSTCAPNYLKALENIFQQRPQMPACSIDFAHPLEGQAHPPALYQAIAEYELHLRYYLQAQRWAGFPYAYHTVGSSMAVRADAYQQQGGMNRRKAGEDFYFLHKFIPFDTFGELLDTQVFPSPRQSDRVPFGTGKSVADILTQKTAYQTYALDIFYDLKIFLDQLANFDLKNTAASLVEELPPSIRDFLATQNFEAKLVEIQNNTASVKQFRKRFFTWFNAFQLMKYVHFARDHFYPNEEVDMMAWRLLSQTQPSTKGMGKTRPSTAELLQHYRQWQSVEWLRPKPI